MLTYQNHVLILSPYTTNKIVQVVPVDNNDTLYIFFPLPNIDKYYKYKPLEYIFYLLGYSGEGSMYDILKKGEYCTKIRVSMYESDTSFYLIGLQAELTKKGLKYYDQVIDCIKSYIKLVKHNFSEFVIDEMKILNDISFNYSSVSSKIDYVSTLSINMLKYKIKDIVYGDYILKTDNITKNKQIINECLKFISIKKSIIVISSKSFANNNNLKEMWYNTEYQIIIPQKSNFPQELKDKLKLPIRNEYIPYNLTLIPQLNNKLINTNNTWSKASTFNVPKVFIDVILYTDKIMKTPKNYLLFEIYISLFEYANHNKLYYARLCETGYTIDYDINFLTITFYGFNNNIHKIIEMFINTFFIFIDFVTESLFEFIKNELITDLENYIYDPLTNISWDRMRTSIYQKYYSVNELLNNIQQVTFSDIHKPKKWLYKNCNMKTFVYGNINDELVNSTKYFDIFISDNVTTTSKKLFELHDGTEQIYIITSQNKDNDNYLINIFFEIGTIIKKVSENWISNMLSLIFVHMFVKEQFFTQLRTHEQSGYIVNANPKRFQAQQGYLYGLSFMVQSPHLNPLVLRKRIKKFITDMHSFLLTLQNKSKLFTTYKNNIKLLLRK